MNKIIMLLWLLVLIIGTVLMMLGAHYAGMAVFSIAPVSLVIVLIINLIQKFK